MKKLIFLFLKNPKMPPKFAFFVGVPPPRGPVPVYQGDLGAISLGNVSNKTVNLKWIFYWAEQRVLLFKNFSFSKIDP